MLSMLSMQTVILHCYVQEEDYNGRRVKRTDSGVCCEADERSRGSKDMVQ